MINIAGTLIYTALRAAVDMPGCYRQVCYRRGRLVSIKMRPLQTNLSRPLMDKNVLAAMERWPDVPDVFGWLSLSERGQWRLHPRGDALSAGPNNTLPGEPADNGPAARVRRDNMGEAITSPQILQFINRNYGADGHGRWFFQNGPQRVFVRLDAAPYILRTTGPTQALQTHNGLDVDTPYAWWLDDSGRLYAQTLHGPGLIAGPDLPAVLDSLLTDDNESLLTALEREPRPESLKIKKKIVISDLSGLSHEALSHEANDAPPTYERSAILKFCAACAIPDVLGFMKDPLTRPIQVG